MERLKECAPKWVYGEGALPTGAGVVDGALHGMRSRVGPPQVQPAVVLLALLVLVVLSQPRQRARQPRHTVCAAGPPLIQWCGAALATTQWAEGGAFLTSSQND